MFRNSMLNVFEKMNDVIRVNIYFAGYVATWLRSEIFNNNELMG